MRLVICGSRVGHPDVERWMLAFATKHGIPELTIVGDAPGVDTQALEFAVSCLGWSYACCRVRQMTPSPQRFHDRNQHMVDLARKGDWCLAFPRADSRGTYDCIRRANAAGLNVRTAKLPR